jgi:hypothetical protein
MMLLCVVTRKSSSIIEWTALAECAGLRVAKGMVDCRMESRPDNGVL